jgi:hypothetical protein
VAVRSPTETPPEALHREAVAGDEREHSRMRSGSVGRRSCVSNRDHHLLLGRPERLQPLAPSWPWLTGSGITALRASGRKDCQTTAPLIVQGCSEATKRAGKKHEHGSLRQHISPFFLFWYNGMEGTSCLQRRNRTWDGLHLRSVPCRGKFQDTFDRSALPARCVRATRPRGKGRSRRSGDDDDVLP